MISVMLLLHALLLFLLSISAMATPVPGIISVFDLKPLPKRTYDFYNEPGTPDGMIQIRLSKIRQYRGLWKTVNIPLISPDMNLMYYYLEG